MRRILLVFGALLLLLLVACEDIEEEGSGAGEGEVEQDNSISDSENIDEDFDENNDENSDEANEETSDQDNDTSVSNENKQVESAEENQSAQSVGEDIIWAQIEQNYDFLNSIIADGVTIDEANNTIEFNTDEASHTFDFLTGIEEDDLEFRFVEGEDTDRAIVGFAAIDYENEYSYVIEMILNNVDGKWELTSIDINK